MAKLELTIRLYKGVVSGYDAAELVNITQKVTTDEVTELKAILKSAYSLVSAKEPKSPSIISDWVSGKLSEQ